MTYLVEFEEGLVTGFELVIIAVNQVCKDLATRHSAKPGGIDIALQQRSRCSDTAQAMNDRIYLSVVLLRFNVFQSSFDIKPSIEHSPSVSCFTADTKTENGYVAAVSLRGEVVDCVHGYGGKREHLMVHSSAGDENNGGTF